MQVGLTTLSLTSGINLPLFLQSNGNSSPSEKIISAVLRHPDGFVRSWNQNKNSKFDIYRDDKGENAIVVVWFGDKQNAEQASLTFSYSGKAAKDIDSFIIAASKNLDSPEGVYRLISSKPIDDKYLNEKQIDRGVLEFAKTKIKNPKTQDDKFKFETISFEPGALKQ